MALTILLLAGTLDREQEFHFNSQTLHAFPCPCPLQPVSLTHFPSLQVWRFLLVDW